MYVISYNVLYNPKFQRPFISLCYISPCLSGVNFRRTLSGEINENVSRLFSIHGYSVTYTKMETEKVTMMYTGSLLLSASTQKKKYLIDVPYLWKLRGIYIVGLSFLFFVPASMESLQCRDGYKSPIFGLLFDVVYLFTCRHSNCFTVIECF